MIEVYSENNTNFSKNGNVVLMPTEAVAKAEIGGEWSLKLVHPIDDGGRWSFISEEAVIKAPAYNGMQLFRIRHREKDDFEVAVECEPIFFDSMQDCFLVDVRPTNVAGQAALNRMISNKKYSGASNIAKISTAYYEYKNLMEALQGSDDNAFVSRWGGELEFDNFTVRALTALGADHGVRIYYGKNIQSIKETVDMTDVITRIYPVGYNGRRYSGGYVDSPNASAYPTVKTASREYRNIMLAEDAPQTAADDPANIICANQAALDTALRNAVLAEYSGGLDKPAVTLEVDMADLRNAAEYADFKDLETVSLGDTVYLYHSRLGITSVERVIAIEYDCITESTKKITLGVRRYNYFNQVSGNLTLLNAATIVNQATATIAKQAASTASSAAQGVTDLADSLGTMAGQDAVEYPTEYKDDIYGAVLSRWADDIFSHSFTVDTSTQAASAWNTVTTNTPGWAMPSGRYLIIYEVSILSTGTGEVTARVFDGTDEINAADESTRATCATITTREVAINGVFIYQHSGGAFNAYPQLYGSRSFSATKASMSAVRIGG